jgi:hypothetical protein
VTPDGVLDVTPESTVVTFLTPDKPFDRDVIQTFCNSRGWPRRALERDPFECGPGRVGLVPASQPDHAIPRDTAA